MQLKYKRINFVQQDQDSKKKTSSWDIMNNEKDDWLGDIRWHGAWRQYCFFPSSDDLVFSKGCLDDISHFINQLMELRKANNGKT